MDPQKCLMDILAGLRTACKLEGWTGRQANIDYDATINEVAENLINLAEWLKKGGFPPIPPREI